MDDLSSILSSLSSEDIQRIQGIASSIMPSSASGETHREMHFSEQSSNTLMNIMQSMNSSDDKTELIKALKPFLTAEKQQRADEAMRMLKLIRILPLIKEINIKDMPI